MTVNRKRVREDCLSVSEGDWKIVIHPHRQEINLCVIFGASFNVKRLTFDELRKLIQDLPDKP